MIWLSHPSCHPTSLTLFHRVSKVTPPAAQPSRPATASSRRARGGRRCGARSELRGSLVFTTDAQRHRGDGERQRLYFAAIFANPASRSERDSHLPRTITPEIFPTFATSLSGFPSTSTRSARFPGSIVPNASCFAKYCPTFTVPLLRIS